MVVYSYAEDYGDYSPENPVPAQAELSICVDSDGWYELQKIPGFLALMEYLGREGIVNTQLRLHMPQEIQESQPKRDRRQLGLCAGILNAIRKGMRSSKKGR